MLQQLRHAAGREDCLEPLPAVPGDAPASGPKQQPGQAPPCCMRLTGLTEMSSPISAALRKQASMPRLKRSMAAASNCWQGDS